jgi:hypothetical protein
MLGDALELGAVGRWSAGCAEVLTQPRRDPGMWGQGWGSEPPLAAHGFSGAALTWPRARYKMCGLRRRREAELQVAGASKKVAYP